LATDTGDASLGSGDLSGFRDLDLLDAAGEQGENRTLCGDDQAHESRLGIITRRRILYWLAAMVALLVLGTIIGLIWADTSDVAGSIAVVTNIIGVLGIVLLLIALAVVARRQRPAA
jgi:hypothetical protein